MSLGTAFDPRANSLNALRLAFATIVVIAHSWPLTGRTEPTLPGAFNELGAWAVAGFFAISGYLITMSRERTPLRAFLWRRFLRIYPAFIVVLLVTAFVFAPISTAVMGDYSPLAATGYVVKDMGLYIFAYGIHGTLGAAPYPGAWNGSLWTLFYEALCYVLVGVAVSLVPRTWLGRAVWGALIVGTALTVVHTYSGLPIPDLVVTIARLGVYFAAGSVMYVYRDRIPYRWSWAVAASGAVIASMAAGVFSFLGALPLAYVCIWAGAALPLRRIGAKNDVSYGMYIYAFPVQQLLAITVGARMSVWLFALLAVLCTLPLAWASWLVVERPAMRLKNWTRATGAGLTSPAPMAPPGP
jgi:peptidoglycan/LPS O-acetylase OafA/YrhL